MGGYLYVCFCDEYDMILGCGCKWKWLKIGRGIRFWSVESLILRLEDLEDYLRGCFSDFRGCFSGYNMYVLFLLLI